MFPSKIVPALTGFPSIASIASPFFIPDFSAKLFDRTAEAAHPSSTHLALIPIFDKIDSAVNDPNGAAELVFGSTPFGITLVLSGLNAISRDPP
jgi:hypothetical protein